MSQTENIIVSVICNTYNHEPYIRQCLEGFIMQKTTFTFEVLIHDDASTDKTADIIREYEAKYSNIIKPIYQIENQYSKKTGIMKKFQYPRAKGKYIALCEGDDYWIDPLKLQKQVDFMESNLNYSMCFHNAMILNEVIDKKERIKSFNYYKEDKVFTVNDILDEWYVPTASILFRKDVRKETPSFYSGDYVLSLALASVGKIYYIDRYMSVYRINKGGVSSNFSAYNWSKQMIELLKWYNDFTDGKYSEKIELKIKEYTKVNKYAYLKNKCIILPALLMPFYTCKRVCNKIDL